MRRNRKLICILISILVVVFLVSSVVIIYCVQNYSAANTVYNKIIVDHSTESTPTYTSSKDDIQLHYPIMNPLTKDSITALQMLNVQFVCQISCPDTKINYPVVQGDDNTYYLTHLFTGEENSAGCLFIDCLCKPDFSSANTVIYGHNMKNGTMFADLISYKDQEFYEAHPVMQIQTEEEIYELELIAGYTPSDEFNAWQIEFDSKIEFDSFITNVQAISTFKSGVTATIDDSLVSLSTCSYEVKDSRYIVLGRLIEI